MNKAEEAAGAGDLLTAAAKPMCHMMSLTSLCFSLRQTHLKFLHQGSSDSQSEQRVMSCDRSVVSGLQHEEMKVDMKVVARLFLAAGLPAVFFSMFFFMVASLSLNLMKL